MRPTLLGGVKRNERKGMCLMAKRGKIHIGTSGWYYDHWRGPFYPEDLPKKKFLSYYITHFRTTEINNSFYRLPEAETFRQWKESVPSDFIFSVKASRYITHMKRLKDPEEPVTRFLSNASELENHLGPILFQLPPRWEFNRERLAGFVRALPRGYRYTFEFRDPSWFGPEAYDILSGAGAAFCIYELSGAVSPDEVTADFVYVRLHGPDGAYQGKYSMAALKDWARAFSLWSRKGKDIYCYFDNDQAGYAVHDALKLRELVEAGTRRKKVKRGR
jgi:uncharacterized protein YecE (DUF72 family)